MLLLERKEWSVYPTLRLGQIFKGVVMFIYLLLGLFTLTISILTPKRFRVHMYIICLLMVCFVGAFRGIHVGTDTYGYYFNFKWTTFNPNTWNYLANFEVGFNYFIAFFREYISEDYMTFISFLFCVFIILLHMSINKNSKDKLFTLFFFISLGYLGLSFNIMRQMLGIAIISVFLPYITKRNYIYIIAVIITAVLLHISLILLLLLAIYPCISNFLEKNGKVIYTTIVIITLTLALLHINIQAIFLDIVSSLPMVNSTTAKFIGYLSRKASFEFSVFSYLFHSLFFLIVLYMVKDVKNIYLFSYFLGIVFLNLLGNIDPVFARVSELFLFCRIFLFADIWYRIEGKVKKIIFRSGVLFYSIFLLINSLLKNYGEIVPYVNRLF